MKFVVKRLFSRADGYLRRAAAVAALCVLTLPAVIAFSATAAESTSAAVKAPARERIMVFGDSLSAAYGMAPSEGWVALLEAQLRPRGISVVNASISGETSVGGLSRIAVDLKRQKPTIVLLALGANDGLRGLPVADTRRNLEGIIKAIRAANARAVLIGIQIPPNFGLTYAADFRDMYASLARQNHIGLVPFLLDGLADKLELFQADRLHPIAAAQPRVLQNVLPAVEQALKAGTKK